MRKGYPVDATLCAQGARAGTVVRKPAPHNRVERATREQGNDARLHRVNQVKGSLRNREEIRRITVMSAKRRDILRNGALRKAKNAPRRGDPATKVSNQKTEYPNLWDRESVGVEVEAVIQDKSLGHNTIYQDTTTWGTTA